jgi:hypothetical protein
MCEELRIATRAWTDITSVNVSHRRLLIDQTVILVAATVDCNTSVKSASGVIRSCGRCLLTLERRKSRNHTIVHLRFTGVLQSHNMHIVAGERSGSSFTAEDVSFVADHSDCMVGACQRASGGQLNKQKGCSAEHTPMSHPKL